jgi:hypothetical protein
MTIKCLQLYDQIMVHCMCAGVSMLWFSVCRHINVPVPWQNKYFMVFLFSLTCSLFYCWYWWNSWPSLFKLSFYKNVFFPQYLTTIHLQYKHRIKSQIDFGDSNLNHKYKQEVPVCQYGRLAVDSKLWEGYSRINCMRRSEGTFNTHEWNFNVTLYSSCSRF